MGGGRRGGGKRHYKGGGKWEKKGKICNIAQYFASKKCKEVGTDKYRVGTGIKGHGKWEV